MCTMRRTVMTAAVLVISIAGGCDVGQDVEIAPVSATTSTPTDEPQIGQTVYVGEDEIRPYDPVPALVTPATQVLRAKHAAIDIHCHWSTRIDPKAMIEAMDDRNVAKAVNLSGGWGRELDDMLAHASFAPDRLLIFCNIDFSRIDEPDFGAEMAGFLRDAHDKGAAGLKIFKSLGLQHRDASGEIIPVDDPRLDPIWRACGELSMPVLIHSADPIAFFQPIDGRNERWMQLQRHPSWSFHGEEFPDRDTVLAQRNRVIERHPNTNFIGAHVGGAAEDLERASEWLDRYPNLYLDISGRVAELGRQPYAARRFLIKHKDRILFGTDRYPGRPDQPRYRIYFRFLETDDEYFKYYDHPFPPTGEWRIYGVGLPDDALRSIYGGNAMRLLGGQQSDGES